MVIGTTILAMQTAAKQAIDVKALILGEIGKTDPSDRTLAPITARVRRNRGSTKKCPRGAY